MIININDLKCKHYEDKAHCFMFYEKIQVTNRLTINVYDSGQPTIIG